MTEIELKGVICDKFLNGDHEFPIELDTRLLDEGICDSLGLVQLAAEIEKRAGVRIHDQDITHDNFGTIRAMLGFLEGARSR